MWIRNNICYASEKIGTFLFRSINKSIIEKKTYFRYHRVMYILSLIWLMGRTHKPSNLQERFALYPFHQYEILTKARATLKEPKCEIFDHSDFHDFYTIKPFWVGDFGAKI
jgi:hypothetical protein